MSETAPFPAEIAAAIEDGISVLRAIRDHSGRSLEDVSRASGIAPARLWEIEAGLTSTREERQLLSHVYGYDEAALIDE